ncbi:MAG: branched-chain amino acid ABC transporter permease [Rhizobiaceae bacterium]
MSDLGKMPAADLPPARPGNVIVGYGVWIVAAVILLILPRIFSSGLSISTMCLMGIMIIFALSYNMLLGQTGLLSFGHAVFFGLGGFLTAHAMNTVRAAHAPLPLEVFPLVGGFTGLVFGIIFGAVSTRRAGTAFAMITLGIGELVSSSALILRHVFGGEEGISVDRTRVLHLFGIGFGPQEQVYYLIAVWCFVSVAAMYAITRTPFGRICNAVRDNPDRVEYIGYNTTTVRFIAFSLAGMFAGLAGGLAALNFEIVTSSAMGAGQSGAVVLMTYIGGVGNFAGPIIGAVLVTYLQVMLSDVTGAWQLYFALLFIAMVMFAPGGIAGLLARQQPLLRGRQLHRVLPSYAAAALTGLIALTGLSMVIEISYQLAVNASDGPQMSFMHVAFNAASPLPWLIALVLLVGGGALFLRAGRWALMAYNEALAAARARGAAS